MAHSANLYGVILVFFGLTANCPANSQLHDISTQGPPPVQTPSTPSPKPSTDSVLSASLLPGTCDFDTDVCGYSNDSAGTLLWARSNGAYIRGIEKDHTNGTGSFLYLTTNTIGSVSGQRSGVVTPILGYDGAACVSFYYMMAGKIEATVSVIQYDPTVDNSTQVEVLRVWDMDSTSWNLGYVDINSTLNSTLTFQSTKRGFFDYVAIDDIQISTGKCNESQLKENSNQVQQPPTPSYVPFSDPLALPGTCDFDTDLCGYENSNAAGLLWGRSGDAYIRGIDHDHTNGSGSFLYLETNQPYALTGMTAGIISPSLGYDGGVCVSFFYRMAGKIEATVSVIQYDPTVDNSTQVEVLRVWDTDSTSWNLGYVDINSTLNSTIEFKSRKTGFFDYVAIDDIHISARKCSGELVDQNDERTSLTAEIVEVEVSVRKLSDTEDVAGEQTEVVDLPFADVPRLL